MLENSTLNQKLAHKLLANMRAKMLSRSLQLQCWGRAISEVYGPDEALAAVDAGPGPAFTAASASAVAQCTLIAPGSKLQTP